MSKESLSTQDTQREDSAPAGSTSAETYGLPPQLVAQITRLTPGDSEALAQLMSDYRELANAILMVAASHVGNAAVRRAIDLVKQKDAYGSNHANSGAMNHSDQNAATTDSSDLKPIKHSEYGSFLNDASDARRSTEPESKPSVPAETKMEAPPAWVAGAKAYNAAHPELVAEFNDLTESMCAETGELDPQAVARWQGHHGLPADGKVGPHTVAAARAAKARPSPVAGPSPSAAAPA